MVLSEAIKEDRKVVSDCKSREGHFIEKLETFNDIERSARNKAVDEFVEKLNEYTCGRNNGVCIEIPLHKVIEIANQIKYGEHE